MVDWLLLWKKNMTVLNYSKKYDIFDIYLKCYLLE